MSSTVLKHALVCASFAACGTAAAANEPPPLLSCEAQTVERAALQRAPAGVHRIGKHVLEVKTRTGLQRFIDRPPHDEGDMSGVHWRYCGYDAQANAHLIERMDEGLRSGELLFGQTGKRVHAGFSVLFSPDRNAYLAIEQEDGVDGEDWTVYDATGKAVWKGYAGAVAKVDGIDNVVSTFEHPQWNAQGELTARFVCASSKASGVVTLARSPVGAWSWRGHGKCS